MDKVRLVVELVGYLAIVCAVFAKLLPEGKAKEVFARLGTLPIAAVKEALSEPKKETPGE